MLYLCIMLVLIIDYKMVNEDSYLLELDILEIEVEQKQSKHERHMASCINPKLWTAYHRGASSALKQKKVVFNSWLSPKCFPNEYEVMNSARSVLLICNMSYNSYISYLKEGYCSSSSILSITCLFSGLMELSSSQGCTAQRQQSEPAFTARLKEGPVAS